MAEVPDNIDEILIFLAIISIIAILILGNVIYFFYKRKTRALTYLFWIFTFFVLAMIANIIGIYWHYITYVENGETYEPAGTGIGVYLIKLFIAYRIAFVFLIMSIWFSFELKELIFEKARSTKKTLFTNLYFIGTLIITIFLYKWHGFIYDLIDFILILILVAIVYFPFAKAAKSLYQKIEEPVYKRAIQSLYIMSVCLIMQFALFVLERIVVTITHVGFSTFYYFGWAFGVLSLIFAFSGYIRPNFVAKDV
jgi:hypothetical protein